MNVAPELARAVATGLGIQDMPAAMPKALTRDITPEVSVSPALSLFARPGDGGIRARRVAILVADGCDGVPLVELADRLAAEGAVPRFVSLMLGAIETKSGGAIEVDVSLEAAPSVLYDAVVLPGGAAAVGHLSNDEQVVDFIKDQYRHCKPILALGDGTQLLEACRIGRSLPGGEPDPGLIVGAADSEGTIDHFIAAIAKHRHFVREAPPVRA
jgi:catalase